MKVSPRTRVHARMQTHANTHARNACEHTSTHAARAWAGRAVRQPPGLRRGEGSDRPPGARLYIGSISASPAACPLRGYGRAGTHNDRLGEAVILSAGKPVPAQWTYRRSRRDRKKTPYRHRPHRFSPFARWPRGCWHPNPQEEKNENEKREGAHPWTYLPPSPPSSSPPVRARARLCVAPVDASARVFVFGARRRQAQRLRRGEGCPFGKASVTTWPLNAFGSDFFNNSFGECRRRTPRAG